MTTINGIVWSGTAPSARRIRGAGGFVLAADLPSTADAPGTTQNATPVFAAFMEGLLGLQEQAPNAPAVRDREARRHGQALLSALAEMQLSLVGSRGSPASLARVGERLSALADGVPVAADPRLREVVAAITLRARVELARCGG